MSDTPEPRTYRVTKGNVITPPLIDTPITLVEKAAYDAAVEALRFLAYPNPPDYIKRDEMVAYARAFLAAQEKP